MTRSREVQRAGARCWHPAEHEDMSVVAVGKQETPHMPRGLYFIWSLLSSELSCGCICYDCSPQEGPFGPKSSPGLSPNHVLHPQ